MAEKKITTDSPRFELGLMVQSPESTEAGG